MEFLVLLVPFITAALMYMTKWLAGLATVGNSKHHVTLRLLLIVFSMLGVVSTGALNGSEIDPDSISGLVSMFFQTGVSAYLSHAFYRSVTEPTRRTLNP